MPKILCIDDNAHGLRARRVLLEGMGHTVTAVRSGREGLDAFASEEFDVAIVDYVMPQMNGDKVVRAIKRANPKFPVIILSGYAETLGVEETVPEADCVLNKGAREVAELTNALNRLLRKRMKKPGASIRTQTKNPTKKQGRSTS